MHFNNNRKVTVSLYIRPLRSLLDADQEIPWADQPIVFHHKYRFWVQPYNTSYHTQLTLGETVGSALLVGSPWEFDVPKCGHGVPGCSMVNGTWIHTVRGSTMGRHTFSELSSGPHPCVYRSVHLLWLCFCTDIIRLVRFLTALIFPV